MEGIERGKSTERVSEKNTFFYEKTTKRKRGKERLGAKIPP